MFSTKKRGRYKEKVREEIRNFGHNIYPWVSTDTLIECLLTTNHVVHDVVVVMDNMKIEVSEPFWRNL